MSISWSTSGNFKNTETFLKRILSRNIYNSVGPLAAKGTAALRSATPVDSRLTADSWTHEVKITNGSVVVTWTNTNVVDGVNVAIILQYGHGTGTGGWVAGRDYINPALKPIFDEIADAVWREVTRA